MAGSGSRTAPVVPAIAQGSPRIVAWVDFDFQAAREGVARLAKVLAAQRFDDRRPVELRFVGSDVADAAHLTADLTRLIATRPALIVASSVDVAATLVTLHCPVPVYFVIQSDPVRDGLVPSLLSPGRMTGYTFFVPLDVKIMEILQRAFPATRTVGIVADSDWLRGASRSDDLFDQAKELGLNLEIHELKDGRDIARLRQDASTGKAQVWYVPYTGVAFDHGPDIVAALSQSGYPAVYAKRKFLKMGGLMSIQSVDDEAIQVWAASIAQILNGAPIGSIPIMRPKEIEVAVNSAALSRLDPAARGRIAREATAFED